MRLVVATVTALVVGGLELLPTRYHAVIQGIVAGALVWWMFYLYDRLHDIHSLVKCELHKHQQKQHMNPEDPDSNYR